MEKIPTWIWIVSGLLLLWLFTRKPQTLALSGGYYGTATPGVAYNGTTFNDLPSQIPPAAMPPASVPRGATSGPANASRSGRGHF